MADNGRYFTRRVDSNLEEVVTLDFDTAKGRARTSIRVPHNEMLNNPYLENEVKANLERKAAEYIVQEGNMVGTGFGYGGAGYYTSIASYGGNATTYTPAYGPWVDNQISYGSINQISNSLSKKFVLNVRIKWGRHTLTVCKSVELGAADNVDITQEDIDAARVNYIKNLNTIILVKKAERKAEDLLKMFISEVDFRNYKEKGYFNVRSGDRLFKIYKDHHKWVDTWERKEDGLFVPKNRLCTHTATRELPLADEAIQKLMLIRSNRIEEFSNAHSIENDMKEIHESDLVLA